MAWHFNRCPPFTADPIQHLLVACWLIKHIFVPKRSLGAWKTDWWPSQWESCSSFAHTCIRCKLLLANHFSKLRPFEWTKTMFSNISNDMNINYHSFYLHGSKFHIYKNEFTISFTSWRQHIKWSTLVVVLAAKFLASCPFSIFLFHHPLVLTCYSCHDLRMKVNHEPIAQEWTFQNHETSCHKKNH